MEIVVIGGGVGGLATAIGLQSRGFSVSVHERAPAVAPVGAGIAIAPNSARLLTGEFGIQELPNAFRPTALHLRRWQDGGSIFRQPLGEEATARYGAGYLTLHRADLLGALVDRLAPGTLHLGREATKVVQHDGGATVEFADGSSLSADLVIGADGLRSPVAAAVGIPTVPRSCGYAAYRGLVPREAATELGADHTAWLGPDQHFVHYPISGGTLLNFVAIVPSPRDEAEAWNAPGELAVVREHFAGWGESVRRVLDAADQVTLWGLYDRPVREELHTGRVALVGDAAHPVLPFFAQGASLAVEDAAVLCAVLEATAPDDLDRGLAAYSAARVPRVRRVQGVSYRNATMFHLPDGPEQQARDDRLAVMDGGDPMRENDWLYAHDVRDDAVQALAGMGRPGH